MTFIPLFILALPIIEIAVFILVGGKIGVLWTIALVILSAVAGSMLLRIQGFGVLNRIRVELDAGRDPGRELAHGAMIMLAGRAAADPGLRHRRVRAAALHPAGTRCSLAFPQAARRGQRLVLGTASAAFGGPARDVKTIDLDAEDYSRTPDPKSPWRIGADD